MPKASFLWSFAKQAWKENGLSGLWTTPLPWLLAISLFIPFLFSRLHKNMDCIN